MALKRFQINLHRMSLAPIRERYVQRKGMSAFWRHIITSRKEGLYLAIRLREANGSVGSSFEVLLPGVESSKFLLVWASLDVKQSQSSML